MAQLTRQMDRLVELKSSAAKVYDMYRNKCFDFKKLEPQVFRKVELVSGNWDCVGSIREWTFVDGTCDIWKDTVEDINDNEMSITWALLDGKVPKASFVSLKVKYQFTANGEGCKAKAVLTFEKKDDTVPDPVTYADFICAMLVLVDKYLCG